MDWAQDQVGSTGRVGFVSTRISGMICVPDVS